MSNFNVIIYEFIYIVLNMSLYSFLYEKKYIVLYINLYI